MPPLEELELLEEELLEELEEDEEELLVELELDEVELLEELVDDELLEELEELEELDEELPVPPQAPTRSAIISGELHRISEPDLLCIIVITVGYYMDPIANF